MTSLAAVIASSDWKTIQLPPALSPGGSAFGSGPRPRPGSWAYAETPVTSAATNNRAVEKAERYLRICVHSNEPLRHNSLGLTFYKPGNPKKLRGTTKPLCPTKQTHRKQK